MGEPGAQHLKRHQGRGRRPAPWPPYPLRASLAGCSPLPGDAAQILAIVEPASVCSSWMGVRKLPPPGRGKEPEVGGASAPRDGLGWIHSGHSPGGLGGLQALWCRYRASRAARGASRPRPRPRLRTMASWGPVGRGLLGRVHGRGPSEVTRQCPPLPVLLTLGGLQGGCGGTLGRPGPGCGSPGRGGPGRGTGGLPGPRSQGAPVLTDSVRDTAGRLQCPLPS